jgi:hypothetical protein
MKIVGGEPMRLLACRPDPADVRSSGDVSSPRLCIE